MAPPLAFVGPLAIIMTVSSVSSSKINRCPLRHKSGVQRPPLVIGHRGASFHLPEHTISSYRLALEMDADFIEPDLVASKDGILVAVHSVDLNVTTNVHTFNDGEFQSRARTSKANKGAWGYYVNDFTWDELQKLTVRQRVKEGGARFDGYDGLFKIPSFTQIVDMLHDWNSRELPLIGRPGKVGGVPGLYVEIKSAQFFMEDGSLDMAELFLNELSTHPKSSELLFDHVTLCDDLKHDEYRVPPLVVQSFEADVLEKLRVGFKTRWMEFVEEDELLSNGVVNATSESDDEIDHPWIPPMVLLISSSSCKGDPEQFWFEVNKYHIAGLGPDKKCLLPSKEVVDSGDPSAMKRARHEAKEWVLKAHSERLAVHPWTVRIELEGNGHGGGVPSMFSSAKEELAYYFCELNVDGVFSENIGLAQTVAAEGCGDDSASPRVQESGKVCMAHSRNAWLLGLSFLAIGIFVGSISTCFVSSYAQRKGARSQRSMPLPELDLDEDDDEDEMI